MRTFAHGRTFLFAFTLFVSPFSASSQQQWLSPGHFNGNNLNKGVAVDPNGAVYTTGSHTLYPTGGSITLRKYDPRGKVLYEKKVATDNSIDPALWGNDIGVNLDRNTVVIGGNERGKAYLGFFRADNGSPILPKVPFPGTGGAEITKIDVRGDYVWAVGVFQGTITLGNGGPTYNGSIGYANAFVAKYNLVTGACEASAWLHSNYLRAYDIKVDNQGNVLCTFKSQGKMDTEIPNYSYAHTYVPANPLLLEVLLVKFAPSLQVGWAKPIVIAAMHSFTDRCPIALAPDFLAKNAYKVIVGGFEGASMSSFLYVVNGDNGQVVNQIASIPSKTINDIAVSNCQPQSLYVTGNTNSGNMQAFLDKYALGNLSLLGSQTAASNGTLSWGMALALEGASNPVCTGHYTGGALQVGSQNLGASPDYTTMTGLMPDPASCCANRGLAFDGVDDYLGLTAMPLAGDPEFTFEAWVYSTATNTGSCYGKMRRLLGWGIWGSHQIEIGECSGNLMVNYYSFVNTQIATNAWLRGGWHHVAVVRSKNPSQLTVYVDGQWVDSKPVAPINISPAGSFMVGRATSATNGVENWKGRLDEVRLWDRARSQAQIVNQKDCALTGSEPGLQLYFPLDHGIPSGQNAGATIAWNYANNGLYANLRYFSLNGVFSNWICSDQTGLVMNGACTPFAPDPDADERAGSVMEWEVTEQGTTSLRLFPNPNSGVFWLELPEPAGPATILRITDLAGRVLSETTIREGSERAQVEAVALPAGLYLVQALREGWVVGISRFVKQ